MSVLLRKGAMRPLLLAALLALSGCTGHLVHALEERQAASCLYWQTPFTRGITATGGVAIERCLADPCRGR